jgi:hypothetical protein
MAEIPANSDDQTSRYIYSNNDFSSNGVKHSAFVPPTAHPNELSVCITSDLSEAEIWKLAPTRRDKTIKARGDLIVSGIQEISDEQGGFLQVLIDGIPHPRHANIKNLPLQKSLQRAVATELANKAKLALV